MPCPRRLWRGTTGLAAILWAAAGGAAIAGGAVDAPGSLVDTQRADERIVAGYRRYHAGCNHCHGPAGLGSSFGPSLLDPPLPLEAFRRVVLDGLGSGGAVMKGYRGDPNIEPHIDAIHAYLAARALGDIGRGRPER